MADKNKVKQLKNVEEDNELTFTALMLLAKRHYELILSKPCDTEQDATAGMLAVVKQYIDKAKEILE